MRIYKIRYRKSARKELAKIPGNQRIIILKKLKSLEAEPFPQQSKKLMGYDSIYRLKVGVYRIVYEVSKEVLVIEVIRIAHRKEVYQRL